MIFIRILLIGFFTIGSAGAESIPSPAEIYGQASVQGSASDAECSICIDCGGYSSGMRKPISCHPSLLHLAKVRIRVQPKEIGSTCQLEIVGKPEILPPEFILPTYPEVAALEKALACPPARKKK